MFDHICYIYTSGFRMRLFKTAYIFACVLLVFILGSSCSGRKNEAQRKGTIPKDDMIDILTELYVTDGLLIMPFIQEWYQSTDSISAYRDVIAKYGYTKADFDRTMRFYFMKKPKKLMKIYEQALARLSEMESRYEQEASKLQSQTMDFWNGRQLYSETGDSTGFDIRFGRLNHYLSFTVTVFPDDQSVNPRPAIYTCHPDSAETGKRHYIRTLAYIKDGQPHKYVYLISDKNRSGVRLMGDLFYPELNTAGGKHFIIEDISLK